MNTQENIESPDLIDWLIDISFIEKKREEFEKKSWWKSLLMNPKKLNEIFQQDGYSGHHIKITII